MVLFEFGSSSLAGGYVRGRKTVSGQTKQKLSLQDDTLCLYRSVTICGARVAQALAAVDRKPFAVEVSGGKMLPSAGPYLESQ